MDQQHIESMGLEIFKRAEGQTPGLFQKDFWAGRVLEWSIKNPGFKVQMFRFVDVLPYLTDNKVFVDHLKEYFESDDGDIPAVFKWGVSGLGSVGFLNKIMADVMRKNVSAMAKIFITGENTEEAFPVLRKLIDQKICFTVDILGEVALSEKEALEYQEKYISLLDGLTKLKFNPNPVLTEASYGKVPLINVSVKLSSLYSQTNSLNWTDAKEVLKKRLYPIVDRAKNLGAFINLDMEHYQIKNLTLEIFKEFLLENPQFDQMGCVIQAYLKDSESDLKDLAEFSKKNKRPFTIRLVKGAYWDYEVAESIAHGHEIPVFLKKEHSDANYEKLMKIMLDNFPNIRPAFGTHNVRTMSACMAYAKQKNIPQNGIEFQMLYGMAEPIKKGLVDMGYRVRDYAPVGELLPGMAYLVRRLLENTSNESFLKQKFSDSKDSVALLREPRFSDYDPAFIKKNFFKNVSNIDFAQKQTHEAYQSALKNLKLPIECKSYVGGSFLSNSTEGSDRECPSDTSIKVARVNYFNMNDLEKVIQKGIEAEKTWGLLSQDERSNYVEKLANLMERDRLSLSALITYETGKAWGEADGDVAEAIDFCRYYAIEGRKLFTPKDCSGVPGEDSKLEYRGRGLTLVIAPWNFPLAILTGMSIAAAVTGNPVIMKPAETSSAIANALVNLIHEAKFPAGVIQCLYGRGSVIGKAVANRKEIKTICFTGSVPVGMELLEQVGKRVPGQNHIKKVIAELGGKNAVIVDSDADFDEAISGILYSAFGYQGQKCSACSRVILLKGNEDKFYTRLKEAAKSIPVGTVLNPKNKVGPVIDKRSFDRIKDVIEKGKKEHELIFGEVIDGSKGYFIGPHIFKVKSKSASLFQEEIFGPVLTILEVDSIEEAVEAMNDVEYGLTGGVYSRLPSHVDYVKKHAQIGNLYINRGITGAIVGRHPFGGKKMSGIGSKAGGPDYLLQFVDPITITENTMRRGFTPELLN